MLEEGESKPKPDTYMFEEGELYKFSPMPPLDTSTIFGVSNGNNKRRRMNDTYMYDEGEC